MPLYKVLLFLCVVSFQLFLPLRFSMFHINMQSIYVYVKHIFIYSCIWTYICFYIHIYMLIYMLLCTGMQEPCIISFQCHMKYVSTWHNSLLIFLKAFYLVAAFTSGALWNNCLNWRIVHLFSMKIISILWRVISFFSILNLVAKSVCQ